MPDEPTITIVTSYPINNEPVIRNRLDPYFSELKEAGWRVNLITTTSGDCADESMPAPDNVDRVTYVKRKERLPNNLLSRALYECSLFLRIRGASVSAQQDVLFLTVPSIFLLFMTVLRRGTVCVLEIRDLVWDYLPEQTFLQRMIKRVATRICLFLVKRAHLIVTTNNAAREYLRAQLPENEVVLISNGIGSAQFLSLLELRPREKQPDTLRVAYIGNIGIAQDLTTLVRAAAGLQGVEVDIVGDGTDYGRVRQEIDSLKATNVRVHGRIPWRETLDHYGRADVLYLQITENYRTATPSKIYEYLATGKQVIFSGTGATREILSSFENVSTLEPQNVMELRRTLTAMRDRETLRRSEGNVQKIGSEFIREREVQKLVDWANARVG